MNPNPELARNLLALAERLQQVQRAHFEEQLKQELKEQAKERRRKLLDGRKRDRTRQRDLYR